MTIAFGVVAVLSDDFRDDILLVGPALLAPLVTLATAMAGMSRARRSDGDGDGHPPPREPGRTPTNSQ